MARTVGIGHQDFGTIQENNYFYIDGFYKEVVGKRRQRYSDYTSEAFWKDADDEYDGAVLFREICGAWGPV